MQMLMIRSNPRNVNGCVPSITWPLCGAGGDECGIKEQHLPGVFIYLEATQNSKHGHERLMAVDPLFQPLKFECAKCHENSINKCGRWRGGGAFIGVCRQSVRLSPRCAPPPSKSNNNNACRRRRIHQSSKLLFICGLLECY